MVCSQRLIVILGDFLAIKLLTQVSYFVSLSNIISLVYNLTINRLTNEQRLQIIAFYYQKACSVKKVHRELLPFYSQFSRPTEAAIRAIVTNSTPNSTSNSTPYSHCWILNHQHAYVECELKKISQLYRPVLIMTINYRFVNRERYPTSYPKCKSLTCITWGFNKTVSHATQNM